MRGKRQSVYFVLLPSNCIQSEQLYLDGQIPGYIFRNILKDYDGEIDAASFRCYPNEPLAFDEGTVCTE